MGRARWKGFYIHPCFLKKKKITNSTISVWSRTSTIISAFVGYKFLVHSGKIFKKLFITREKIGYKFGEFCTTRCKYFHKNKLKTLSKKKLKK